ncbi:hypothetical protein BC332_28251 [Capsicum chinense]|nr:hypothetical protein BC332_28251 [Capsicum chinense]
MNISSTTTTIVSSYASSSILPNFPLLSSLIAFALAQSIKFFTSWYREKHWDLKQLVESGGMPSSHSATVTALATAVGLLEGFGGSLFAAALVFACVNLQQRYQHKFLALWELMSFNMTEVMTLLQKWSEEMMGISSRQGQFEEKLEQAHKDQEQTLKALCEVITCGRRLERNRDLVTSGTELYSLSDPFQISAFPRT